MITKLYETVALKPGVRELLARLKAAGARMCICSNTWSAQCRTVLTRLGINEYFDFYVEAQGALHKSRPDVFFQTWAALTLTGALSARIPSTPPAPPTTQASASSASPMPPASPMSPPCGRSATSS